MKIIFGSALIFFIAAFIIAAMITAYVFIMQAIENDKDIDAIAEERMLAARIDKLLYGSKGRPD